MVLLITYRCDLNNSNIIELATQLGEHLLARERVVGTAESCTGGMVAAAITAVSGSSEWFHEGLVTYSNASKQKLVGVPSNLLDEYGAVSQQVVESMMAGVLDNGADIAVATSGIAGPTGGTDDKPVGCVWFCWGSQATVFSEKIIFSGDREAVRLAATGHALKGLIGLCKTPV